MLKAKIHNATITAVNPNALGTISIDEHFLLETGIRESEKVHIININNGARFETYVAVGRFRSGDICMNGSGARFVQKGDKIIIIAYCTLEEHKAGAHAPKIIFVNEGNLICNGARQEPAETLLIR